MALAGALFAWAVLGIVAAPRLLDGRPWAVRRPRLALSLWAAIVVTGVTGAVTGLVLVLRSVEELATQTPSTDLSACQACRDLAVFGAGWLGTAVVGGLGSLVLYSAVGMALERRRLRRLTRLVVTSGSPVVFLDLDEHVAACGPHRGSILVSTALRDLLSSHELGTVIEHERSHLRQHHQLLASAARLQRSCLPLTCTRACERTVLLLLELAADDSAARRCGHEVTAEALTKVGRASADPVMHLRAQRLSRASLQLAG